MQYWEHIDRVFRAQSLDEVKSATSAYTRALGFQHHGYAMKLQEPALQPGHGGGPSKDFFYFEDFASDWSKTYPGLASAQAERSDPRIIQAREGLPAASWNCRGQTSYELGQRVYLMQRTRRTLEIAGEHGLRGGITVPSWSQGVRWSFMTFTHTAIVDPREMVPTVASAVYFVNCMQATLDRLMRQRQPLPTLSEREREVLRWSAVGKTSWEISVILRISERTVNFHLQQVSRKLGVKGRRAACARAVALGLIFL
ncbi:helix-turn-helix transcriptional regulator [Lysobacter antibioticus]|uniref:helix-turn-helix transcriptional regulator n=1 Tax=Lysobacter antibioticus TaxID=84531 RepID=UPI00068D5029|nr:LuxR family transcriptional regulator [Lysobacter antibioticus]